jgi:hypothetical protein
MKPKDTPFHDGERRVQERAGEKPQAQRSASVISSTIMKAALSFLGQQYLLAVGSLDTEGNPWASVLLGEPGFVSAQDEQTVILDNRQELSSPHDPIWENIHQGADIGMLAIDLMTRRRLRINGYMQPLHDSLEPGTGPVFIMSVDQAYPNCPRYIQKRQLSLVAGPDTRCGANETRGTVLNDEQMQLINAADTFFVASANPGQGVDVSHRGGNPGFVQVLDCNRLRIPDYRGNSLFNTLGNFSAYPRAGLIFIDFQHGRSLQMTGEVSILWDQEDVSHPTGGTHRYWEMMISRWIETSLPRALRSELIETSSHNPG